MKSLESLIPFSFAEAIGSTLLHSLWQLSALALILMLILAVAPARAAKFRYWSATVTLAMMFLLPIGTFSYLYHPESPVVLTAEFVPSAPQPSSGTLEARSSEVAPAANSGLFERISGVVQANSYVFFGVWIVGVVFFSIRFVGGCWQVNRLRHRHLEEVPEELLQRFKQLGQRLGIQRNVGLSMSRAIPTPMVIGVFKPIVLLPVGLLSGLSMEQVECILVHELSHVRRLDYLVNLVQSAVEILLFFHPAIWWVSRVIRVERENCCDALVVDLPSNKVQYARALLSLEIMRQQGPTFALSSQDGDLASRIRRITGSPDQATRKFQSRGLLFGLIVVAFALIVASQAPTLVKAAFPTPTEPQNLSVVEPKMLVENQDSPITKIVIKENGEEVAMDFDKQGKVVAAKRNGEVVPQEELGTLQEKANRMMNRGTDPDVPPMPPLPNYGAVPPMPPMPPMPNFGAVPPMPPFPAVPNFGAVPPIPPMPPMADPNSANFDSQQFEKQMEQFGKQMEEWGKAFSKEFESKDWEQFGKDAGKWAEGLVGHVLSGEETEEMKALHRQMEEINADLGKTKDQRRLSELHDAQEKVASRLEELHSAAMERNMGDFEKRMEDWGNQVGAQMEKIVEIHSIDADKMAKEIEIEMNKVQMEVDRASAEAEKSADKARAEGARAERAADRIGAELVQDQLISNPKAYKVKINNKEFQVNGKRQSDALHGKYKQLFEQQLGFKVGKDWMIFEQTTK
jgi:bla regulator protein BlaR1